MIIPFEGWAPDQADLANPGDIDASGVLPYEAGYRPSPGLSAVVSALDARCRGAASVTDSDGNAIIYAADQTKLYQNSGATFSNVSKSGNYSRGDDSRVEFALYGNTVISTDYDTAVQGKAFSASLFSDLIDGTHKPKARTMAVVGNFLMLGNTNDTTDGQKQSRVWWSAARDITDFDPSASTQSDFEDIGDGGWVQRIVGLENSALIFMERQIIRARAVGPPLFFDFSEVVDKEQGTSIPGSVAAHGRRAFFWSHAGFYANESGVSHPIGDGKVDREFHNQIEEAHFSRVSSAIDDVNKLYVIAFPGTGNTAGLPNRRFFYHWPSGRWAYDPTELEWVFNSLTLGYTLDQLDDISASLDALPYSLDSRAWTGGRGIVGGFNTSHAACTFTGSNAAVSITTKEVAIGGGRRVRVNRARPLIDTSSATLATAARLREADTASFDTARAMATEGHCPVNVKGRYHSFKLAGASGLSWNFARGIDIPDAHIRLAGGR